MAGVGGGCGVPRSHAEIVAAMSSYAAGVLTGRAEGVVQRHLAGGCRECLDLLFSRPIGLRRTPPAEPTVAQGALRVVSAVLVVIALMGTVLASTMWLVRGVWPSVARDPGHGNVTALEAHASEAGERLASIAVRSTSLRADLKALAPSVRGGPLPEERDAERPSEGAETARVLARLGAALSMPATTVESLRADRAASSARGWVIWDSFRGRLFVYAVGLPRLMAPWEAHVALGADAHRVPLRRLFDGSLWGIVDRVPEAPCAAYVSIVPPRADRTVLTGQVRVCAGPRA